MVTMVWCLFVPDFGHVAGDERFVSPGGSPLEFHTDLISILELRHSFSQAERGM
jgi:hypothetical protein